MRRRRGRRGSVGLLAMLAVVAVAASCLVCLCRAENAPGTTGVLAGRAGGKRTLVLTDRALTRLTHSRFFDALERRGHQLTFKLATDPDVSLVSYGEFLYDNLVLFAPKAKIRAESVMHFTDGGGNVLVAADVLMSSDVRRLAALSGVDFDRQGSKVIDHMSFSKEVDSPEALHTAVLSMQLVHNDYILGKAHLSGKGVIFRGVGHVTEEDSVLATKVLWGMSTTYSAEPYVQLSGSNFPDNAGGETQLVTAVQGRNNARIVISGSLDMFSDRFFDVSSAANEEFCIELSKWVFGERGILRASDVTHIRKDGTPAEILLHQKERLDLPASQFPEPEIAKNSQVYRIKDDILYSLVLEEYDEEKGGWVPYWTDDVQMELVMLDPYERVTLECDRSSGQCSTYFTAPDTYGIFKIRVMYRRPGLTVLKVHTQVSIRPFKHNEYERFIGSAMPYYAAVFSTMGAFFIFSFFFLYSSSAPRKAKSKTT